MTRIIRARVDSAALRHNLGVIRRAAPDSRVMAVVKANAYGHGLVPTALALSDADSFAVARLEEGLQLRSAGVVQPIVLLEGVFSAEQLAEAARQGFELVVHDPLQLTLLEGYAGTHRFTLWVKIDTGMNRLGFRPEALRSAWARLDALPQVDEISLITHFSDADGPRGISHQVARFEAATRDLPGERSLSNSAATLRFAGGQGEGALVAADWVRPGILVYGSAPDYPAHDAAGWVLQPAMTLRAKLIALQSLQPGDRVGYGGAFTAEAPMRIGVVACGYADGYPRVAPTGTPVLVNGVRTRTVGRVSMDMITVDLTPVPEATLGAEVTLWGRGPNGSLLGIDEVARSAGTVGYELMCALARRVPVSVV